MGLAARHGPAARPGALVRTGLVQHPGDRAPHPGTGDLLQNHRGPPLSPSHSPAIAWLERSVINTDPAKNYTHGRFLEVGTNRPLIAHREGTNIENGRYWIDYNFENPITHMGMVARIDIPAVKREYERVKALTPAQARAEYLAAARGAGPSPAKPIPSR